MSEYSRHCPNCDKILSYSSYKNLWRANKYSVVCVDCSKKLPKKQKQDKYFRNCPSCNVVIFYSSNNTLKKAKGKLCASCAHKSKTLGRKHTLQTKEKISKNHARYWLGRKRTLTESHKTNIRLATIEYIKHNSGQIAPRYNSTACAIFELINLEFSFQGKHAERGGEYYIKELGYWVDYYEPNINLVIEYDERYHRYIKEKDKIRQSKIKDFLRCKFVRITEKDTTDTIFNKIREVL